MQLFWHFKCFPRHRHSIALSVRSFIIFIFILFFSTFHIKHGFSYVHTQNMIQNCMLCIFNENLHLYAVCMHLFFIFLCALNCTIVRFLLLILDGCQIAPLNLDFSGKNNSKINKKVWQNQPKKKLTTFILFYFLLIHVQRTHWTTWHVILSTHFASILNIKQ